MYKIRWVHNFIYSCIYILKYQSLNKWKLLLIRCYDWPWPLPLFINNTSCMYYEFSWAVPDNRRIWLVITFRIIYDKIIWPLCLSTLVTTQEVGRYTIRSVFFNITHTNSFSLLLYLGLLFFNNFLYWPCI